MKLNSLWNIIPGVGAARELRKQFKERKGSYPKYLGHLTYAGLAVVLATSYLRMGTKTDEWNLLKQPVAACEYYNQKQTEQRQEKERIFRVMIQDNDFNENGSLEQGSEQEGLVKALANSDLGDKK